VGSTGLYDRRVEPSPYLRPEYQHTHVTDAGYGRAVDELRARIAAAQISPTGSS